MQLSILFFLVFSLSLSFFVFFSFEGDGAFPLSEDFLFLAGDASPSEIPDERFLLFFNFKGVSKDKGPLPMLDCPKEYFSTKFG